MNIRINAAHFDTDVKLEEFIKEKINKLVQLYDEIIGAEVHLQLEKSQTKNFDSKVVKIKLEIPGYDLFAEKKAGTFEEATDNAVDALKTQIIRKKEKKKK